MLELLRQSGILFATRLLASAQQGMLADVACGELARRISSLFVSNGMGRVVGVSGAVVRAVKHPISPATLGHSTHRALPAALPVLAERSLSTRVRGILTDRAVSSREVFTGCPGTTFVRLLLQSKNINPGNMDSVMMV